MVPIPTLPVNCGLSETADKHPRQKRIYDMLLECPYCEVVVDANEIGVHEYRELDPDNGHPLPWVSKVTFACCPTLRRFTVRSKGAVHNYD